MASNGNTEDLVLDLLEQINEQGVLPVLVQEFSERGEIDQERFTGDVQDAMIDFLVERGVSIETPDALQKFHEEKYDEHFALAYDHAIRSKAGQEDPIDATRTGGTVSAWDFTVDTFDEIEEQGIVRENILAAGAIDYIYELGERMGIFRLADALVLEWSSGAIDVVDGHAADLLYRYFKLSQERSSPEERGMVYRRVLDKGHTQLLDRMVVNEHFAGLWQNLMGEVAEYIEKLEKVEEGRAGASRAGIHQATRELQYNLTEYCTGMAHIQARELYAQLQEALEILRDEEIIAHFGGSRRKSLWTVIERLSKSEFGQAPNIGAIRTAAADGNRVFQWIAGFEEGTTTDEEFEALLSSAEAYILAKASDRGDEAMFEEDDDFEDIEEEIDEFEDDF